LTGELSASAKFTGFSANGWAEVCIDGEDSEILQELVSRKFGRAQTNLAQVEALGNYSGIISDVGDTLNVDIGVERPTQTKVSVGAGALRAQLCDGKTFSAKQIAEYYCMRPGMGLSVRITRVEPGVRKLEGWLSDSQIQLFSDLMASRLEQIRVFDCTRRRLESALRRANLERDVISLESNTLTMHSVVCKLGTDAVGLIPKLGSMLRRSELRPFLPKRILAHCRQW
jgi:hypothetical protein